MAYRFIDSEGVEHSLETPEAFLEAVRTGQIERNHLLMEPGTGRWAQAGDTEVYRVALAAKSAPSSPAPDQEGAPHPTATDDLSQFVSQCPECLFESEP